MRNIVAAEQMKLRKNKIDIILLCVLITLPILFVLKNIFIEPSPNYMEYFYIINGICLFMFPMISGMFVTFIVQKEYQDHTIINTLTAPISKSQFIFGKMITWIIWYIASLAVTLIIFIAGYKMIYPEVFELSSALKMSFIISIGVLLNFAASLPVLFIVIKQKMLFYPSILISAIFAAVTVAGLQASEKTMLFASMVPWSATSIIPLLASKSFYWWIGLGSVAVSACIGIFLSLYEFNRQEI